MPVYRLDILDPKHSDWAASSIGACSLIVHAPDEAKARTYAFREFGIAAERDPSTGSIRANPWGSPEIVKCTQMGAAGPQAYIEGLVIPDPDRKPLG